MLYMREPEDITNVVRFDHETTRINVSLEKGGTPVPYPTDSPYGKRHPLHVVSSFEDESVSQLVFELTQDALIADDVAFLIYLGDQVVLRRADSSWSVGDEPEQAARN